MTDQTARNKDDQVIKEFGEEWKRYQYDSAIDDAAVLTNFNQYFAVFPWSVISDQSEGFDMGCGSGRWARFVAPRVGLLNCVEPSAAIEVAQENLSEMDNVRFYRETTDQCSLADATQDFGYSLGVLHHIPDTQAALADCARLLKPGAPLLLYLYYDFENRPVWFRMIWKLSNALRMGISKLPRGPKKVVCEGIAALVYWPLTRLALGLEKLGINVSNVPLSDYRTKPYYQMRNDALDRFGTRLEQRFSRADITAMLTETGFRDITFSEETPFWCVVAYKL